MYRPVVFIREYVGHHEEVWEEIIHLNKVTVQSIYECKVDKGQFVISVNEFMNFT